MSKYIYETGDIEVARNQCWFCKYNREKEQSSCDQYENKPREVLLNTKLCPFLKDVLPAPWEKDDSTTQDETANGKYCREDKAE